MFNRIMLACFVVILVLKSAHSLHCPPGISSFAADSDQSYYKCTNGEAVQSTCSSGQHYDRYSGKCITAPTPNLTKRSLGSTNIAKSIVNSDALGRIVSLGTLYDARQNNIWNGFSMWSEQEIKANVIVQKQPYSKTRFFTEKNFRDRAALFNLDAELKLSFLAGLIEVKGSAHYLRDSRETNEKIRVNMDYYAITDAETIPHSLPVTYPEYCKYIGKEDGPTHVISSVTHGMRAVFVFERTTSNTSTAEEVSGSLSVAVKNIPSFQIEGSAVVDVKGKVVDNIDSIEVKFYGDVILEKTPSTYIDAIKVFDEIPAKVKDTKSVIKFQMTPIEFYCDDTEVILLSINKNLVDQTNQILEDFSVLERDSNSLISTTVSKLFYSIRKSFNTFDDGLNRYSNDYKSDLIEKLPALKAGTISETDLVTLLNKYNGSPFKYERARIFLEAREREINTIELVIEEALGNQDIEVTDSSTANDNTCIFKKDFTTIYVMYVLPKDDIAEKFIKGEDIDNEETKWFDDNAKVGYAGKVFKKFVSYANINKGDNQCFLIQLKPLHENPNVMISIVAMKNGVIISDNFIIPDTPANPTCEDNGFDAINLNTKVTTNSFVKSYQVTYAGLEADGNWTTAVTTSIPHTAKTSLTALKPSTLYKLQLRYTTVTGNSQPSEVVYCKTAPASAPALLRAELSTDSTISVKWNTPEVIAPGLPHSYIVSIQKMGGVRLADSHTKDLNINLSNLKPSSVYEIDVCFQYGKFTGPKATITTVTAPVPPPQLSIKTVAQNSVTLLIDLQGVRVAKGTKVESLTLHYTKLDAAGSSIIPGTALTRTIPVQGRAVEAVLSDLAAGTTYSVKYKLTVSNIAGSIESGYNNAVIVRTTYKKSELQQFKETLGLSDIRRGLSTVEQSLQSGLAGVVQAQTKLNTEVEQASTALAAVQTNVKSLESAVHDSKRRFFLRKRDDKKQDHWAGEWVEEPVKACGRRRFRNANMEILYYNGKSWGVTYPHYAWVTGCGTGFAEQAKDYSGDVYFSIWDNYYVVDPEVIRH